MLYFVILLILIYLLYRFLCESLLPTLAVLCAFTCCNSWNIFRCGFIYLYIVSLTHNQTWHKPLPRWKEYTNNASFNYQCPDACRSGVTIAVNSAKNYFSFLFFDFTSNSHSGIIALVFRFSPSQKNRFRLQPWFLLLAATCYKL